MSVSRQAQATFGSGEIGPEVYSRTDIEKYKSALKTCRNGYPKPQGGWSNRAGTRMVAATKNNGAARLVKFVFSTTQAYQIEFGDEYCRFYKNRAQILSSSVPYEIVSPYAIKDVPALRFEYSGDTIYITHNNYQPRMLQRYGDTDWRFTTYAPEDGPFLDENTDVTSTLQASGMTGSIVINSADEIFTTGHVGALWKIVHYVQSQKVTHAFGSVSTGASISCFTTWRLITHGTWTGSFTVEKSIDGGSTWTALQSYSSANDFNANTSGTEDTSINLVPFLVRINFTAWTSGTANIDLSTDAFYQNGIVRISAFTNTKRVTATVIQTLASTSSTFTWSEGAWSDYRGWPAMSRFFQDRLGFFCTIYQPMRWDFTQTSNYTSFRRNAISLLETDGISKLLNARQLNAINGIVGFKSLLAFTSSATWSISSGDGTSFTPNNNKQDVEEYIGSEGIDPVTIGNEAIFVQTHGKVVRNIVFQLAYNSFNGADINVLSRHLTNDSKIVAMEYQKNPDSIVWMIKADGTMIGLTYLREQEVIAWHRHDTDGKIESISVIPGDGYDELWMIVSRETGRFVEVMEQRITDDVRLSYFVDCGVTIDSALNISGIDNNNPVRVHCPGHGLIDDDRATINNVVGMEEVNGYQYKVKRIDNNYFFIYDIISGDPIDGTEYSEYVSGGTMSQAFQAFAGLDWLEGQTVSILADGLVLPQQVVTDGVIDFGDEYYATVNVGLPYLSDLETLDIEVQGAREGTTQGRNVKCHAAVFRFLDSRGGWVGPSELDDYGKLAIYEAFLPLIVLPGKCAPLQSGNRRATLGGNYSTAGRIFYRQYDPLPVTITAIVPEISVGGIISS